MTAGADGQATDEPMPIEEAGRRLLQIGGWDLVEALVTLGEKVGLEETLRILSELRVDAMRSTFRVVR